MCPGLRFCQDLAGAGATESTKIERFRFLGKGEILSRQTKRGWSRGEGGFAASPRDHHSRRAGRGGGKRAWRGDGSGHAAHGGHCKDPERPRPRRRGPGRSRCLRLHWSTRPRRKARPIGSPRSRPGRDCWRARPMPSPAPGGRRSCSGAITASRWVRSAASPATRPRRGASCSSCGSTPIRTSTRR